MPLTVSPGSESLLFAEEILGVVVSQVQQSSLISSNLAMSRSLERGRGRSTSSLAAPSSAGAFRHGQQRRKRSSSASKFNSRKRSRGGGGGVGSFFRTFGFPEVGAITLPDPVRRLSVPPLAGLEGQRCGALGGGGVAVRIPHSFPLQASSNQGSYLPASLPPFVHQRGGSGGGYSGPCGQECGGACSSTFPRLLQPAFRCVEDLRILETRH